MKKILVAHDGSNASEKALWETAGIAQKLGASLTVVSVVPNVCFIDVGVDCDTVSRIYRAEVEGVMERVKAGLSEKGIEAGTSILEGNPADAIVDYAKDNEMDLIALGSTGKHSAGRTLLGSVSSRVLSHASCSVIVIR